MNEKRKGRDDKMNNNNKVEKVAGSDDLIVGIRCFGRLPTCTDMGIVRKRTTTEEEYLLF